LSVAGEVIGGDVEFDADVQFGVNDRCFINVEEIVLDLTQNCRCE